MKIYGPYTRKDGRKHIIRCKDGVRTTQSYPRYLMELHLNRPLLPDEHVDHIDEDFTNDCIENLQLLSSAENARKHMQQDHKKAKMYHGICGICGAEFTKRLSRVKHNLKLNRAGPFCSRSCAGKYGTNIQHNHK